MTPESKATQQSTSTSTLNPEHVTESTGGLHKLGFPVVGIGASAGGLDAFKKFFSKMPIDSRAAFVLVPHLDPTHESLMVELIARQTKMPVCEASDAMVIEANRVYVIPPNKYLAVIGGKLRLSVPANRHAAPTAIDCFFTSLAREQGEQAIGVILSGTSSHGTLGIREIKLAGGMVMVQTPESAEYDQMPRSAIATGLVDYIFEPEQMPEALVKYMRHPYVQGPDEIPIEDASHDQLNRVLAVLKARTKHDCRCYHKKMLMRRVLRRMGLCHVEQMSEYLKYLHENPDEVRALYKDLLIGVTEFFRDPEAFQVLQQCVIPTLVERSLGQGSDLPSEPGTKASSADIRRARPTRVWVPACATGEEAYSIAILLIEQFTAMKQRSDIQIFATDIDEESLETARLGIYSESSTVGISPERLQRYFNKIDPHRWQVNKQLRESITFVPQSLISDAPFSKLDLISCRNLLIYLEPDVQSKVIRLFHFALAEGGFLLLGPSESIGREVELFETVSKKWRVFQRTGAARSGLLQIPIVAAGERRPLRVTIPASTPTPAVGFRELMQRLILDDFSPAAVLVNRKFEIVSVLGPLVNYLEFPPGEITKGLLAMARSGLRTRIRAAVHKAMQSRETVIDLEARVKRNGTYIHCTISVKPITEPKDAADLLLVIFRDREAVKPLAAEGRSAKAVDDVESKVVSHLEFELKSARDDLQSTIEEYEDSTEELKAANEEVMSMNEELQSANEELETSKEELQSLNEELTTVNSQLQEKVEELDRSNNDLLNLMSSSEVATVFLDVELRIKRFTPPVAKLLSLRSTDLERPLSDLALKIADDTLLEDCRKVIEKLIPIEKLVMADGNLPTLADEVRRMKPDGGIFRHYLRRIVPYHTGDNRIGGVIITFIDITDRVVADARSRRLASVLLDSNDAVTVQEFDGRIIAWNRAAERMYGYAESEAIQMNIRDLVPEERRMESLDYIERILRDEAVAPFETQRVTKHGRVLDIELTVNAYRDENGKAIGIATTERNISGWKKTAKALRLLNVTLEQRVAEQTREVALLAKAISHLGEGVVITAAELDWPGPQILFVNEAMCNITGYSKNELIGQTPRILQGESTSRESLEHVKQSLLKGRPCSIDVVNYRKDGTPYDAELFITPLLDAQGHRTNFVSIHRDIGERKRAEQAIQAAEFLSRSILDSLTAHVAVLEKQGRIVRINKAWENFAQVNGVTDLARIGVGENYLDVCTYAASSGVESSAQAIKGLQEVLHGRLAEFTLEYSCHSPSEQRWFLMSVTPIANSDGGVVVSHQPITERKRTEDALRREHELNESIIGTAQTIVLVLDTQGQIVRFNPYMEKLSGRKLDEARGLSWFDNFVPECDRERVRGVFARAINGERTRGGLNPILTKDGRHCDVEWYDAPLTDSTGEVVGLLCTGQDITERLASDREIHARENRIRAIVNTATDAIVTIDHVGLIQSANPSTETMFGYAQDELIGHNVNILMPEPYCSEHDTHMARYLQTGESHIIGKGREVVARRKDGTIFPVDLAVSRVEQLNEFTGVIRDISLRKELQKQVLEIAVEEQRRIGQELHDGTGQELTGLALFAGTLVAQLVELPRKITNAETTWLLDDSSLNIIRQLANRLSRGLNESNRHVQQLSHGIMPVQVEPEGLRAALESLASETDAHPNIQCTFDCPVPIAVANNAVATHLYRIAQEAVNNAMRHSRANHIRLSLLEVNDEFILEVSDNGTGFETGSIGMQSTTSKRRGFGLDIMKYRASMIGGALHISRRSEGGMLIKCVVSCGTNHNG